MTNESIDKICLSCGTHLQGRRDKKFCSDQCRATHYNKMNFEHSHYVKKVNIILRKNWRILVRINAEGKTKTSEDDLLLRGFNFNYFTSLHRTQSGDSCYYCYDQGYFEIAPETYLLVEEKNVSDGLHDL